MRDHPAVLRYAHSFNRTTDAELDDLLQEGRVAVLLAERAVESGRYDPKIASLNTYTTRAVYRAMCDEFSRGRRRVPTTSIDTARTEDSIMEWDAAASLDLEDTNSPSPDRRLLITEMVRDLPDDARAVVDLVLGDLYRSLPTTRTGRLRRRAVPEDTRHRVRRLITGTLGWSRDRAEAAFAAITRALGQLDEEEAL